MYMVTYITTEENMLTIPNTFISYLPFSISIEPVKLLNTKTNIIEHYGTMRDFGVLDLPLYFCEDIVAASRLTTIQSCML